MGTCFKFIPLFLSLSILLFPLILWLLSFALGHITLILPYVSDTGLLPPEASLFSLSMCSGSCVILLFVLLRYDLNRSKIGQSRLLTETDTHDNNNNNNSIHNDNQNANKVPLDIVAIEKGCRASLITGLLMAFGFLCIGCFRNGETNLLQIIHNIFAAVGFISAVVDIWIEFRNARLFGAFRTSLYRRIIFCCCIIFMLCYEINCLISFAINPVFFDQQSRLMWSHESVGYVYHVLSAGFEWLLIYSLAFYFLTYHHLFVSAQYLNKEMFNLV